MKTVAYKRLQFMIRFTAGFRIRHTLIIGMTFDHDFGYSLPPFSFLLIKEGRRKVIWIAKIMIKSHDFLIDLIF